MTSSVLEPPPHKESQTSEGKETRARPRELPAAGEGRAPKARPAPLHLLCLSSPLRSCRAYNEINCHPLKPASRLARHVTSISPLSHQGCSRGGAFLGGGGAGGRDWKEGNGETLGCVF